MKRKRDKRELGREVNERDTWVAFRGRRRNWMLDERNTITGKLTMRK